MTPFVAMLLVFILAVIVEGAVEALFGQPIDFIKKLVPFKKLILTYISIGFAIALTTVYKVDIVSALVNFNNPEPILLPPLPGFIASGLIAGRGSNFVHDFYDTVFQKKPKILTE